MMNCTIKCRKEDCEFHYQGSCSYGGDFLEITANGCNTYEPKEDVFDAERIKADAKLTEDNILIGIRWAEALLESAEDENAVMRFAVIIKALELAGRLKELADA